MVRNPIGSHEYEKGDIPDDVEQYALYQCPHGEVMLGLGRRGLGSVTASVGEYSAHISLPYLIAGSTPSLLSLLPLDYSLVLRVRWGEGMVHTQKYRAWRVGPVVVPKISSMSSGASLLPVSTLMPL